MTVGVIRVRNWLSLIRLLMLNHPLFSDVGIMTRSSLLSIVRCRNRFWTAILVMLIRTKCSILVRGDSVFIIMVVIVREVIAVGWTIICNRRRVHRHFTVSLPDGRSTVSGIPSSEYAICGLCWPIDKYNKPLGKRKGVVIRLRLFLWLKREILMLCRASVCFI